MKFHFANSSSPLKEGRTLKAVCGEEVPSAAFAVLLDCAVVGKTFSTAGIRNLCRKCNNSDLPGRFIYVISNGQEYKTKEIA